jgi:hypothetical protein
MTTTLTTRWASLLTRIGWDYTYRGDYPVSGTGAWFDVHGDHPLHVVVVPDATTESDYRKPIPLIDTSGDIDTLLVGAGPFLSRSRHTAGIMSDCGFVPSWDEGLWFRCRECQRICVRMVVAVVSERARQDISPCAGTRPPADPTACRLHRLPSVERSHPVRQRDSSVS